MQPKKTNDGDGDSASVVGGFSGYLIACLSPVREWQLQYFDRLLQLRRDYKLQFLSESYRSALHTSAVAKSLV
jgi:hypothetical protein